jgi:hypothetical protein
MRSQSSVPDSSLGAVRLGRGRLRAAWLDAVGIAVSVVCAIHCAASALFLATLALLGVSNSVPDWLEWVFLSASVAIGTIALRQGHEAHGQSVPLRLFGFGGTVLLFARVADLSSPWESFAVVIGASALVVAHTLNWRHGRHCQRCASRDPVRTAS